MYNPPDGDLDPYADEEETDLTWLWITIGVVVVIGLALGGWFLFKGKGKPDPKKSQLQRTAWTTSKEGKPVPPTREWYDPRQATDFVLKQSQNVQYAIGAGAFVAVGAAGYFGYKKYKEQPVLDTYDDTDLVSSGWLSWFEFDSLPGKPWMWITSALTLVPGLMGWLNQKFCAQESPNKLWAPYKWDGDNAMPVFEPFWGQWSSTWPLGNLMVWLDNKGWIDVDEGWAKHPMRVLNCILIGLQMPFSIPCRLLLKIGFVESCWKPVSSMYDTCWRKVKETCSGGYDKITGCCCKVDSADSGIHRRRLPDTDCPDLDQSRACAAA